MQESEGLWEVVQSARRGQGLSAKARASPVTKLSEQSRPLAGEGPSRSMERAWKRHHNSQTHPSQPRKLKYWGAEEGVRWDESLEEAISGNYLPPGSIVQWETALTCVAKIRS